MLLIFIDSPHALSLLFNFEVLISECLMFDLMHKAAPPPGLSSLSDLMTL